MVAYIKLYALYRSATMRAIRLLILFGLLYLNVTLFSEGVFPRLPHFFLHLFVMIEIFFHFKIGKVHPHVSVNANTTDPMLSFTRDALGIYLRHEKPEDIVKELLRTKQVQFMLAKSVMNAQEVSFISITKEAFLQGVLDVTKKVQGTYVTTMDLFAAYLLLIEPNTKLLFNKHLKPEEFIDILRWARLEFPSEETPKKFRMSFTGSGFGEVLLTGWTPETRNYTTDWTLHASKKPYIIGREEAFKKMVEGLSKPDNNNILLVGDIGVGKENLILALIYESFANKLPSGLNNKHVLELMLGPLLAGATDRGLLQERIQAIIDEVSHAGNIILYVPQFENVLGSGSFNLNLAGVLLPHLEKGNLPIIATMTVGSYKSFMERNPLQEVFEVIKLDEPTKQIASFMLLKKASELEWKYGIMLTYKTITTAVNFADRYLQDTVLPGSAVSVLEDALQKAKTSGKRVLTEEDITGVIEDKTHIAVGMPKAEEKELLLHLEEKIHERVVNQVEAVGVIAEAMRRIRTGMASQGKPISFLFLGPTGVGKTETAKALASIYFGGDTHMIRLDMSEYSDTNGLKRLLGAAPGEGEERGELTDRVHDSPFSLILLDEFEKAHPSVHDLFLQVLEDGRLTDNKGRTASFANSIIIATSNAGSEFIREELGKGTVIDKGFEQKLLDTLQGKQLFRPELLNRFDDIVTFKPLGPEEVKKITTLLLRSVTKTLHEQDIVLTFDDKVVEKIASEGFDQQFGARPLRRYIQDNIEDLIAKKKLTDEIKRGSTVLVTTDQNTNIQLTVS